MISGPFAGTRGVIETPAWSLASADVLAAGPPDAYLVSVTTAGAAAELQHILSADLVPDTPAAG